MINTVTISNEWPAIEGRVEVFENIVLSKDSDFCPRFQYLEQTVVDIKERMNVILNDRRRAYQVQLLKDGALSAISPWTGEMAETKISIILHDKNTIFLFPEPSGWFALVATDLGLGFPITAVLDVGRNVLIDLEVTIWKLKPEQILIARSELIGRCDQSVGERSAMALIVGDPNFAHHIWNQLGALDRLIEDIGPGLQGFHLFTTHQPLGSLDRLFPELTVPVQSIRDYNILDLNKRFDLICPLSGRLVTESVRSRIKMLAQISASPVVLDITRKLQSDAWRAVWISVRTAGRTAVNQVEMLVYLIVEVLRRFPNFVVVLDGMSVPADFHDDRTVYDKPAICNRVYEEFFELRAILRQVGAIDQKIVRRVIPLVGLHVLDAAIVADCCCYYFCHYGTVQHKIAWLVNKPGVIHSNIRTLAPSVGSWVADQVEGGVIPTMLPVNFIEDLENSIGEDAIASSLRLENYRFKDITNVCNFFIEQLLQI